MMHIKHRTVIPSGIAFDFSCSQNPM